jgi:hypothetical protein
MYQIDFEPETGVLRVQIEGIWTLQDVERYQQELGAAVGTAIKRTGRLMLLVDVREAPLLPAEAAERFKAFGRDMPASPKDRIAFLLRSELMKYQMKRLFGEAPLQFFMTEEDAYEWLQPTTDALKNVGGNA